MASSNVCWGVEVGAGALKALKLGRDGDQLRVLEFVEIPHARPMSAPDVDETDAVRVAVGTLASQYSMAGDPIAISAPGQAGFVRFAKLPPTEPKQVANVVKFEAAQQIPFPLEDVEWAYQTFVDEDSPEIEVGIFAITRERVMERLAVWEELKLEPGTLALSPIAAFNAIAHDRDFSDETVGTVILDIGTTATDLIVIDSGRVWIRTFPMGGHNFTEALVSSFKIDYGKAERLKREADRRKEKRHIFQAMKPVYSDFAQDVQRSLAYYKQLHPESDLKRMVGLGSTFKLIGLRKFLSQSLQMEVVRCERFEKLSVDGPEASDFQSKALQFATAYGLALQGLGLASIDANLVPTSVVRANVWRRKTPWFVAAAAVSIVAGAAGFLRPVMDRQAVETAQASPEMNRVSAAQRLGRQQKQAWEEIAAETSIGFRAENVRRLLDRREIHQRLLEDVRGVLTSGGEAPTTTIERSPDEWRGLSLNSMNTRYVTPSGEAPKAPRAAPAGRTVPGPTSRTTGSVAGLVDEGRDDGRGARSTPGGGGQAPSVGTLRVQLQVDATNSGQLAFIDATALRWLRENAERDDAPYTLSVPTVDDVMMETVQVGRVASAEAAADGEPAGSDRAERASRREDGRSRRGAERSTANRTASEAAGGGGSDLPELSRIAPLPEIEGRFPPEATVYRYTITFEANLKGPEATRFAIDEEAPAQARAEADQS